MLTFIPKEKHSAYSLSKKSGSLCSRQETITENHTGPTQRTTDPGAQDQGASQKRGQNASKSQQTRKSAKIISLRNDRGALPMIPQHCGRYHQRGKSHRTPLLVKELYQVMIAKRRRISCVQG